MPSSEKIEVAHLAATTAQMASDNIRRYIEHHSDTALGPSNPVSRVMKIADELTASLDKTIDASTELAAKSLQAFRSVK